MTGSHLSGTQDTNSASVARALPALLLPALLATLLPFAALADRLELSEAGYFTKPGLDVIVFSDIYPEGHQTGVTVIQHDRRVAANGDLRLEASPGQWSPVPASGERVIDARTQIISQTLAYPDPAKSRTGFNPIEYPDLELGYTVRVQPNGPSSG